jgi:hypothetical protein
MGIDGEIIDSGLKPGIFFQNNNNSTFEWARILFRILNYCLKKFFAIELEI